MIPLRFRHLLRRSMLAIVFVCIIFSAAAKKIETEILINASPARVWAILIDAERYPAWNPFIKSMTGDINVGNKIKVIAGDMKFKPRVLAVERGHKFSWRGRLLFGGLFDGRHTFELIDNGNGTTTFRQYENFTGLFVPFFKKRLDTETRADFEGMNKKLKELAERN